MLQLLHEVWYLLRCRCSEIRINEEEKYFVDKNGKKYVEGDWISLDGSTGNVYGEKLPTVEPEMTGDLPHLCSGPMKSELLRLEPMPILRLMPSRQESSVRKVSDFAVRSILFFDSDRIPAMREMIVARTENREERLWINSCRCREKILKNCLLQWRLSCDDQIPGSSAS